jgi:hypothetical protein
MRRDTTKHFHPRDAAGSPRWVRFDAGHRLVRLPATTAIHLYRWRSVRKPGPFVSDLSVPLPGERVALVTAPGQVGTVLA